MRLLIMFVISDKIQERIIEFEVGERVDLDNLSWNIEQEEDYRRGQEIEE